VRDPSGGSSIRTYDAGSGAYGVALAADADPYDSYDVLGTDPSAHRAVVWHDEENPAGAAIETYDLVKGTLVAADPVAASDYTIVGGRVDPTRHRAAILAHRVSDKGDVVLPLSLTTGALGAPIAADGDGTVAGAFGLLTIDTHTGRVYLSNANASLICFRAGTVAAVDLDTRAVTTGSGQGCVNGIDTDSTTGRVYELSYRSVSVNIAGTSNLIPIDGDLLQPGDPVTVRQQPSVTLAVDAVHHLALVGFTTPPTTPHFGNANGLFYDNNATSQLAVVDLDTGTVVKNVGGLNFVAGPVTHPLAGGSERRVQLDPATRTGWTYAPDGSQLQRFSY
jgi:hypothetical protein